MSITKKKRRKKRQPQPKVELPETDEKGKTQYQDEFQKDVGGRLDEFASKLEGKGRNIMYGLAALAVLAVLAGIFYTWNRRNHNAAQAALGTAIETSRAFVTDAPVPAGATNKTFKTDKARAEAAIKEFQVVADTYGSPYKDKALYFIAANRMFVDRAAGIKELEAIALGSSETATLSKFALAEANSGEGKLDEAAKFYQELQSMGDAIIPKETIDFALGKIYEKQDKTKEAADLFFGIASTANELKDAEGKPVPLSRTAQEAKERLEQIAPERAKEIKVPDPSPAG